MDEFGSSIPISTSGLKFNGEKMERVIELYKLQYSDLMKLCSDQKPASNEEIDRLKLILESIMQNLGRDGPGLLCIHGVPEARALPETLFPLARKLALLNDDHRKRILKDHNLGSDVPLKNQDRIVSSFAMQMKYDQEFNYKPKDDRTSTEFSSGEFKDLGFKFQQLGFLMMELGLRIARVCDKSIGGCELEQSLLQCGTAKGRLIHYHSVKDISAIKTAAKHARSGKVNPKSDISSVDGDSNLWQQWHYDYGIFTILTAPIFMLSEQECESPSGHTYLQVFHPEMNCTLMVKASKGSFIVQVGESADVLSKGKLRATLHSVVRPAKMEHLSRETFVVFLQPAWTKRFSLSDYPVDRLTLRDQDSEESCNGEANGLSRKIHEIVPPLFSRLRDGMTFAEFSRETTKRYYGGQGLQSNR